jgi:hypothetical protein
MLELIYFLRFADGEQTCDYNFLADAITAQFYATPVELRQPVVVARESDAGLAVAHILEQRGKVPVKLVFVKQLFQSQP